MTNARITIDVEITDQAKLHATAKRIYVDVNEGRPRDEVEAEFETQYGDVDAMDVAGCLRLLFDRGDDLDGVTVNDSHARIEDGSDRPAGYGVQHSVWDDGKGGKGLSWMVFDPDGTRFEDDYGTEEDGWRAARHHARTGEQLPADAV